MKNGIKKILIVSTILVVVCSLCFAFLLKSVTSSAVQLDERMLNQSIVNSPNVQLGNRVKMNADLFGGKSMYKQTKDVDGYIIPWIDTYASYSSANVDMNRTNMMSTTNGVTEFAEGTSQKMMHFYKPDVIYENIVNNLDELSWSANKVMEVAISFDKAYYLKDILSAVPANLNIAWLWLESENTDEVLEMGQVYGFEGLQKPISNIADNDVYTANYKKFLAGLDSLQGNSSKMASLHEKYGKLNLSKLQFKGLILTGQEKNFKQLAGASFIRASEIGATADIVPYIKPYK